MYSCAGQVASVDAVVEIVYDSPFLHSQDLLWVCDQAFTKNARTLCVLPEAVKGCGFQSFCVCFRARHDGEGMTSPALSLPQEAAVSFTVSPSGAELCGSVRREFELERAQIRRMGLRRFAFFGFVSQHANPWTSPNSGVARMRLWSCYHYLPSRSQHGQESGSSIRHTASGF